MVEIAGKLKLDYSDSKNRWKDSPFEWMISLPSRSKGAAAESLMRKFLEQHDFDVADSTVGSEADMNVNRYNVEVKFSTLWKDDGSYRFQQIRDQKYDILLCLGISPDAAHAWVICKSQINGGDFPTERTTKGDWGRFRYQHGGDEGDGNTWWVILNNPPSAPSWMRPQGGDLAGMCEALREMTSDGGG